MIGKLVMAVIQKGAFGAQEIEGNPNSKSIRKNPHIFERKHNAKVK
jgi:hypothetical protein